MATTTDGYRVLDLLSVDPLQIEQVIPVSAGCENKPGRIDGWNRPLHAIPRAEASLDSPGLGRPVLERHSPYR